MLFVFSSVIIALSTSIDYIVLLVLLFSKAKTKLEKQEVYLGQLVGVLLLILASFVISRFAHLLPEEWMIGLLGLVPIILGILAIFDDDADNEIEEKMSSQSMKILSVIALSLASGGDNLGIYSPFFSSLSVTEIVLTSLVILSTTIGLSYMADRFGSLKSITKFVETYEKIIVPTVFILLGLYILIECGTITYLIRYIRLF